MLVRRAARLVGHLMARFSYLETPAFLESITGKSESYVLMRTRIEEDPTRRVEHLNRFRQALAGAIDGTEIEALVPEARLHEIATLHEIVGALSNPDRDLSKGA